MAGFFVAHPVCVDVANRIDWSLDRDQDCLGCAVLFSFFGSLECKLFRVLTVPALLTSVLLQRALSVLSAPLAGHARFDFDRFVCIYSSGWCSALAPLHHASAGWSPDARATRFHRH